MWSGCLSRDQGAAALAANQSGSAPESRGITPTSRASVIVKPPIPDSPTATDPFDVDAGSAECSTTMRAQRDEALCSSFWTVREQSIRQRPESCVASFALLRPNSVKSGGRTGPAPPEMALAICAGRRPQAH
jgi:hypothetical protein